MLRHVPQMMWGTTCSKGTGESKTHVYSMFLALPSHIAQTLERAPTFQRMTRPSKPRKLPPNLSGKNSPKTQRTQKPKNPFQTNNSSKSSDGNPELALSQLLCPKRACLVGADAWRVFLGTEAEVHKTAVRWLGATSTLSKTNVYKHDWYANLSSI